MTDLFKPNQLLIGSLAGIAGMSAADIVVNLVGVAVGVDIPVPVESVVGVSAGVAGAYAGAKQGRHYDYLEAVEGAHMDFMTIHPETAQQFDQFIELKPEESTSMVDAARARNNNSTDRGR